MSRPHRILLVDHSRGALLFQETILRRRKESILTALSGGEGLIKARSERPQLVVFGFDLFDMTAPEFCREIRSDPEIKGMSLLLVCERENAENADLCLSAGCNDVIFRPLQKEELDEKVSRLTSIPSRRQLRTITRIEVSLENNGRFILARSLNISANGMLLEVDRVLPGDGNCASTSICRAKPSRCRSRARCCAPNSPAPWPSTASVSWRPTTSSAPASRNSCSGCGRAS